MKTTFAVEPVCGEENTLAVHLYFGDHVRIEVGRTMQDYRDFVSRLERMGSEIEAEHGRDLEA